MNMRRFIISEVESRVHKIDVFMIQFLTQKLDRLAKALEVDNFPFPQEFDNVIHVRIVRKPQNIVIGNACLLLWYVTY